MNREVADIILPTDDLWRVKEIRLSAKETAADRRDSGRVADRVAEGDAELQATVGDAEIMQFRNAIATGALLIYGRRHPHREDSAEQGTDEPPPGGHGKPPTGGQIHMAPCMPSQPYAWPNVTATVSCPVYLYPYIARYAGAGDVNDAGNYRPVTSPISLSMTFTSHVTPLIGPDNQKRYGVRDGKLVVEGAK